MGHLGFTSYLDYSDVWTRLAINSNCQEYYEHVLLCTDDSLVASHEAEDVVRNQIGKHKEWFYWSTYQMLRLKCKKSLIGQHGLGLGF